MRVKALRGVCVGIEKHLAAGAIADLDPALVQYLTSIKAVEALPDEEPAAAAAPADEIDTKSPAKKAGKQEK